MKKIYVECRENGYLTALVENGKLVEMIRDDARNASVAGNIYAGVAKKINAGFVFLDAGLEKHVFLDTRDHRERGLFFDSKLKVKQGDILIVQILRDAWGDKGPAATSSISHVGQFVVLTKSLGNDRINVSRKIDDVEAARLTVIGEKHMPKGLSVIMRSAAKNRDENEIAEEIHIVAEQFDKHIEWQYTNAPAILHAEPLIIKTLREIADDGVDEIVVNDADTYEMLLTDYAPKLQHYDGDEPIFSRFFLKTQIDKLHDRRVWLKSGAFIVIEQTEACVVIDVNSGKHMAVKKGGSALKINIEAAKEIAYQLRLRNLSGIIIVDFIAMKTANDTQSLTDYLRREMAKDRIPANVVGMTALGLMEITRKRVRNPVNAR